MRLAELLPRVPAAAVVYVIQDKNFDYFDGERFVFHLVEAKFYPDQAAVQSALKQLSQKPGDAC